MREGGSKVGGVMGCGLKVGGMGWDGMASIKFLQ